MSDEMEKTLWLFPSSTVKQATQEVIGISLFYELIDHGAQNSVKNLVCGRCLSFTQVWSFADMKDSEFPIPTTMKTIIALLALFLAPQIVTAQSLPISLPEGVTIATATPQQVSDAVAAAIKANPSNAEGIATAVAKAIAGLPNAKALATALATAVASNVPAANVASVIAAASAAAAEAGNAGLASTMAGAAASVVPSQTAAISSAVSAAVPAEADSIANAVSSSTGGTSTTTSLPGNTQSTTQNPANFSGGQATPTPTPVSPSN